MPVDLNNMPAIDVVKLRPDLAAAKMAEARKWHHRVAWIFKMQYPVEERAIAGLWAHRNEARLWIHEAFWAGMHQGEIIAFLHRRYAEIRPTLLAEREKQQLQAAE